jgi:regulator of RNase E activity RraA
MELAKLLPYLLQVDSPTISNAVEALGLRDFREGYLGGQIRCQFPELGVMIGRALTVAVTDTPGVTGGGQGYWDLWSMLESMTPPVVIVMADETDSPGRVAFAGEVMVTLARRLGAVGIVTDGALRDLPEVRSLGFHYFSTYVAPSHAYFDIRKIGESVEIAGQSVNTGDLLHGDSNGVVVIPDAALRSLEDAVAKVRARERVIIGQINDPDFSLNLLRTSGGYLGQSKE